VIRGVRAGLGAAVGVAASAALDEVAPGLAGLAGDVQLERVAELLAVRGAQVAADAANSGVGTLYRYSLTKNVTVPGGVSSLASQFLNTPITNCTRIADGIVHLRLVPYATNGFPLFYNGFNTNATFRTNTGYFTGAQVRNTTARNSLAEQVDTYFMSNAVPAFVELELGILEPRTFERFKALGAANPAAQRLYLSNHVAQVHLFRQRIPVRNVDYSAYQ